MIAPGRRLTRPRWLLRAASAAALVLAVAVPSPAQTSVPGELAALPVPGGRWALAELGVPASVERASAPRILVERLYDAPAATRTPEATVARVRAGLDLANRVEAAARSASPDGALSLALVKNRTSRDRLRDAIEAIGARLQERRNQATVVLDDGRRGREIQASLAAMGLDVAAVAARLTAGETVPLEVPAESLPLALAPAVWNQVVFERDVPLHGLFAEMLRDPRALLLWHGALALDDSTRRFLEAAPELIRTLHREAAPLFSAYGGAVVVRNARVQVGGGAHVPALWEQAVGESLSTPAPFVRRLFTQDNGRMAMFFDLVQALPEPQRDFATGAWMAEPGQRLERFRALYGAVVGANANWTAATPLARQPDDPWMLLRGLAVDPTVGGNRLAGPQQRRFWERAFENGVPADPVRALRDAGDDGVYDAAWIVDRVCNDQASARADRFRQLMVVPRAFPAPAAADLPGVLMAARGLVEFPALVLALERRGLLSPALAEAAVRQAARVQAIGGRDERARALALFQGATALVDRLVATGTLTPATAGPMLSALMAVPLRQDAFGAGVGEWIVDHLLPALPPRAVGALDAAIVSDLAMATSTRPRASANGVAYVVDWAVAERGRLGRVRQAQGGVVLDDVVRLVQLMRRVGAGAPSQAKARDEIPAVVELEKSIGRPPVPVEISEPIELSRVLPQARRELELVRSAADRDHVARAVDRLGQAVEWTAMHVLLSLAYTPFLDEATAAAARPGDPSMRHRFGVHEAGDDARRSLPWAVPVEIEASSAASGALLGLDHALARLSLRRLQAASSAGPSVPASVNAQVLTLQAALASPRTIDDRMLAGIAAALARGRELVQAARTDRAALEALAAPGRLAAERRSLLGWMAAHEPERVSDFFTLTELATIGGSPALAADAIGPPTRPLDARLGVAWRGAEAWEPYAGRPTLGLLPTLAPDLPLRVAELTVQAGLPAPVYPAVLGMAIQDVVASPEPEGIEDWLVWVRRVRALSRERFEAFVAALPASGLLVPADRSR